MITLKDDGLWWPIDDTLCKDWTHTEGWIPQYISDSCDQLNIKKHVIIHAGGNVGVYALEYADQFETVVVAEPNPINFECLHNNCASTLNIKLMNVAFGNSNTECTMDTENISNCGLNRIVSFQPGNIKMIQIDDMALTNVSVIHLDVEGFELPALIGAVETIKTNKPLIAVEVNDKCEYYGYSITDIRQFLYQLGYNMERQYASEVMFYYEDR